MKIFLLFLSFVSLSFAQNEDDIYLNYLVAARNNSTIQFNLVINFKNLITNETKEICIEGEQLLFALYQENNLEFDEGKHFDKIDKLLSENKSRFFEFKNPKAIERLNFYSYSNKEFKDFKKNIDFDEIVIEIKSNKKWKQSFDSEKILFMYAHELFNRGILTGQNGCMGGGTLILIDRNNPY